jgi:hypothetical protein
MPSALFDSLCALFDAEESAGVIAADPALAAELSARLASEDAEACEDRMATLALCDVIEAHPERAPADLVEAEIRRWSENGATVVPLAARTRSGAAPLTERFMLLAAASETGKQAVFCRSQSGIWTLEVFVTPGDADKGFLLLSVHPDHRATYEGRAARVFVKLGEDERVLAEAVVREGEIYTPISLAGLDLRSRDAINVTFD